MHYGLPVKHTKLATPPVKAAGSIRVLNIVVYVIGVLGPLFALDQVLNIWIRGNADGISILAFGGNCIFAVIWVVYGFVHKEKAIIFLNTLWVIINGLIAVGAIIY